MEHFRVWGSLGHVHISDEKRSKLDDKSMTCILLGFSEESKGYMLYNPETKKNVVSRDVVFEENKRWRWEEEEHTETMLTWNDDDLSWEESDEEGSEDGNEVAEPEPNDEPEQPADHQDEPVMGVR